MIIRSKVIPESDEGRLLWCHKELINISNRCIRECRVNMIIIWKKDACTWLIFPSHFKLFAVRKIKLVNLKGNQPWLLIGRTDAEAETPVFWYLMQTADSLEKSVMLGKIEGRRRGGYQTMRWLNGITRTVDRTLGKLSKIRRDREAWRASVHGIAKNWTWLGDWTAGK